MKIQRRFTVLLLLSASILFTNCTKGDFGQSAKEIISNGKWSVAYFYTGQDKTENYRNLQLNFQGNGTLNLQQGTSAINGTWGMIKDVSSNDVLTMNVNSEEPDVTELNEEWEVTDAKSDMIVMQKGTSSILRLKKQ